MANKEKQKIYADNWEKNNPIKLRANRLLQAYKQMDERKGFGKNACDFDSDWIIKNIFSKPCVHCGKTGWDVVGCNRKNNDLPHTKDNVEPCCFDCNNKLGREYTKQKKSLCVIQANIINGEIINIWESANEAGRKLGISQGHISDVCRGEKNTYKGYKWYYKNEN